jgi:sugar phosphate isomerase/epimerase
MSEYRDGPGPKLAISNFAWPASADAEAIALAARLGFTGIEVAPAKIFGPLDGVNLSALKDYGKELAAVGLAVPALQGILFGVPDVHLFRSERERSRLAASLRRVAEIASVLGAGACVFGAPSLRDPGDMPYATAKVEAVRFFRAIGQAFEDVGAALCFEANPAVYGCTFITGTREAFDLVREIDHPGIKLQLDTGTIFVNNESPDVISEIAARIGHVHVSEPELAPTGTSGVDHVPVAAALRRGRYRGWISVEMRETPNWLRAIEDAWAVASRLYATAVLT